MTEIRPYISTLAGPILVTGASGFVGANLFGMIAKERSDVFAVVRQSKGWRLTSVRDEQIAAVDLTDRNATRHLIKSLAPQTVFHCAAYGAYSFEEDLGRIQSTNFLAVVNLVEMLSESTITAFIHAGSSSEYGTNCSAPTEDSPCEPNSPYAVSKLATANFLQYMGKHRDFPCVNLRLYSVYGPLEDTSRLLPTLVRQASSGHLPPLVHAETSRDFVYVDDVCEAFILAAARIHPGLHGENVNIGSGSKVTIGQLVETVLDVFNVEEEPTFDSMDGRAWDLPEWYSNPSRAASDLGWVASTPLTDGLVRTAEWVSSLAEGDLVQTTKFGSPNIHRSISAIIACYGDAEAIPLMHQRLTKVLTSLGVDYEIIFVNDGSPDNSAEVISAISSVDSRVMGISHSRNFGSQMAFRSGMELSNMDSVVLLDGDLQDPPELISEFYYKWTKGYDVVYGRRVKRAMPLYRGILYKLFYRLFAKVSYVKIPLDAGDFSLMDRRVVAWLLNCPERDLFIRGLRAYVGFRQTGVDYVRPERQFGRTTNSFIKNLDWAKKAIFSFSSSPITILTNVGIVSFLSSVLVALIVGVLRVLVPEIAPQGITTLLITALFFGSLNLLAIGLVGEYVSKIMVEVKRRPRLIRSALIRHGETIELLPDGKVSPESSTKRGFDA